MSHLQIKHKQPFTIVPNFLVNDLNISANALAVISYLAGKPEGWIVRPYDIKKRFKWGNHTWRKVSIELRDIGLVADKKHSGGTTLYFEIKWDKPQKPQNTTSIVDNEPVEPPVENQHVGGEKHENVDNPVDKHVDNDDDPPVDFRTVRKPTCRKSTGIERKSLQNKDLLSIKDLFIGRQPSADNPEGYPREGLPLNRKKLKDQKSAGGAYKEVLTSEEEMIRRQVLEKQLQILSFKKNNIGDNNEST